jgi:hypothetical protein
MKKEILGHVLKSRGKMISLSPPLTFEEVVEQYGKYMKADKMCPPALKQCFNRMHKDLIGVGQTVSACGSNLIRGSEAGTSSRP